MTGRWTARLSELRAELLVMRAAHRALADRVASMEGRAPRVQPASELDAVPDSLSSAPAEVGAGFAPMRLPDPAVVLGSLRELGVALELDVGRPAPSVCEAELAGLYASAFIDAGESAVGAVLVSVPFAARTAGALLGLGEAAISDQIRRGVLQEEAVMAMSEVCRKLCAAVNRSSGAAELRSSELSAFSGESYGFVEQVSSTLCLSDAQGDSIWVVAR